MRTDAIRLLEPHFEHKLFLSATPHNGYLESFTVRQQTGFLVWEFPVSNFTTLF